MIVNANIQTMIKKRELEIEDPTDYQVDHPSCETPGN